MVHDATALAEAIALCRQIIDRLGPGAPMRIRVLLDMLKQELERVCATSAGPSSPP